MEFIRFGSTGLEVSRLCLGCMSFGAADRGNHPWTLDEPRSRVIIKRAVELGFNFFDTANVYSDGTSEEFVGRALRDFGRREDFVLATKVHGRMRPGPNGAGLSRKAIFAEIDASLKRLGTDYVDLYQIHRWDPEVPIEETLEALHDVVKSGKARHVGASSMHAWQFAKALYTSRLHGWVEFASMQGHLNLLYREEEREMLPLCIDQGKAVIPWSPLARGRLARPWESATERAKTDAFGRGLYATSHEADHAVFLQVERIASERGVPRAQVALAWLLGKRGVTAPIVGTTRPEQLDAAVAALSLELSSDEMHALEAPYLPHAIAGFDPGPSP
jgi:aryl-alcohol dehydrogenase-like predicted oxidoreductase